MFIFGSSSRVSLGFLFMSSLALIGWVLRYPAYAVGYGGIIYYMQVCLQIGFACLYERW